MSASGAERKEKKTKKEEWRELVASSDSQWAELKFAGKPILIPDLEEEKLTSDLFFAWEKRNNAVLSALFFGQELMDKQAKRIAYLEKKLEKAESESWSAKEKVVKLEHKVTKLEDEKSSFLKAAVGGMIRSSAKVDAVYLKALDKLALSKSAGEEKPCTSKDSMRREHDDDDGDISDSADHHATATSSSSEEEECREKDEDDDDGGSDSGHHNHRATASSTSEEEN